jgi:hypothetical protein
MAILPWLGGRLVLLPTAHTCQRMMQISRYIVEGMRRSSPPGPTRVRLH